MKSQTQRGLLQAFMGSIACCGAVGIYCLLIGQMGWFEGRILATTAVIGAASILGLVSAVSWERRRWHPLGPVSLAAVILAFTLLLVVIWADFPGREPVAFYKTVAVTCVVGVALPYVGLLSLARLRREYLWVRRLTVWMIGLLAALFSYLMITEPSEDVWFRAMGILAIAVVCGTIAIPILHRVSAIRVREEIRTVELLLSLTCPRCHKTQELSVGRSRCAGCGLKFSIEIEEEQCRSCGYPLYRLTSAVCPECGTSIVG